MKSLVIKNDVHMNLNVYRVKNGLRSGSDAIRMMLKALGAWTEEETEEDEE